MDHSIYIMCNWQICSNCYNNIKDGRSHRDPIGLTVKAITHWLIDVVDNLLANECVFLYNIDFFIGITKIGKSFCLIWAQMNDVKMF